MNRLTPIFLVAAISTALGACAVGPNYERPSAPAPTAFREAPAGWQAAQPKDAAQRGPWWSVYGDPLLDRLVSRVAIDNQNLKAYDAAYREAVAVVGEVRAGLSPTVDLAPTASRQHSARSNSTSRAATASGTWEPDLWGKARRQIESDAASAQASAAELADLTLSAQAELVTDYFELRYQDSLIVLYQRTVNAYERSQRIAQNQYDAGTVARSDVITAQTTLATARASLVGAERLRDQYEHAIALLVGKAPAELTIPAAALDTPLPEVAGVLPSALLERRPDIAEAERRMQQQSAQIGVAQAAYYPTIDLSAEAGYSGLGKLLSAPNELWSLAGTATETLFDGGQRRSTVEAARAAYDQSVASYRQTVLAAFQDVEDELSNLRVLAQQSVTQDEALRLARQAETIATNEYQAGTVDYTTVVTAQATALSAEQSSLQITEQRLVATASLIRALGGGWSTADVARAP